MSFPKIVITKFVQPGVRKRLTNALLLSVLLAFLPPGFGAEQAKSNAPVTGDAAVDAVVETRDTDSNLKYEKGNVIVVPLPLSNPTFGTGLILAGAYFYSQTEEQKKQQPASFTGAAAAYTDNETWVVSAAQQNYWGGNKWRFTGIAAYTDLKLELRDPAMSGNPIDWLLTGGFFQATISRRIADAWYLGLQARFLDIDQALSFSGSLGSFLLGSNVQSAGAGPTLEYDTRDMPTNPYKGQRFEAKAIFYSTSGDESSNYQSLDLRFRSYHKLDNPVVVAWEVKGCKKSGQFPLWDACKLSLRGFPATEYLGVESFSGQVEARWHVYKRLGLVVFAGGGHVGESFSDGLEDQSVPSYGAGVRFMVLKPKRINLRVDYARSEEQSAWYLSVGEAF